MKVSALCLQRRTRRTRQDSNDPAPAMAAKTAATGAYHVEFDGHETEQALAVKLYGAADGIRPSEPHLSRIAKIVVRIAQRQTQKLREHRNAHEGDEEYVPPTAAEEDAWRNNDDAMKEAFSRLSGELETLYAQKRMNAVTAAGAYTAAAQAQQDDVYRGKILASQSLTPLSTV